MGLFGWIKDKAKAVGDSIQCACRKFTGEATFEEADKLYEESKARLKQHQEYINKEVDICLTEIEDSVDNINNAKRVIKTELFPAFAGKIERLKGVSISDTFMKECVEFKNFEMTSMRDKSELYLIDFSKRTFWKRTLAVATLGFYTRKKAKETLLKVKEEVSAMEYEKERLNAELAKLRTMTKCIKDIEYYYTSLIDSYKTMLNRLDGSMNFLISTHLMARLKPEKYEISLRNLPLSQQKEVEAIVTMSKIMKAMVDTQITIEGEDSSISDQKNKIGLSKQEFDKIFKAA